MRIALIDDHPVLRQGLRWLLEQRSDIEVIAEGEDAQSACAIASMGVDVLVLDIGLRGVDGFVATREIIRRRPDARILMLTLHASEELVSRAFRAGATGYALKEQPPEEVVEAIASVRRGVRYVAPQLRTARLDELLAGEGSGDALSLLSTREREVFDLQVRGLSIKEVARLLFVSVKTVDTHRTNIFRKLGVHSIAQLILLAVRDRAILSP